MEKSPENDSFYKNQGSRSEHGQLRSHKIYRPSIIKHPGSYEPSNRASCLQIPSGSVWKTKRGFTSTSLTSYNKQNNVFLMDGESRLPIPY